MTRGGHGLPKVSPGPAMRYLSLPCGRATPEMTSWPLQPFQGWPTRRPSSTPLDTQRGTPLSQGLRKGVDPASAGEILVPGRGATQIQDQQRLCLHQRSGSLLDGYILSGFLHSLLFFLILFLFCPLQLNGFTSHPRFMSVVWRRRDGRKLQFLSRAHGCFGFKIQLIFIL
jgi:hypothetical protein